MRAGRGQAASGTDSAGLDTRFLTHAAKSRDAGLYRGAYWRFFPKSGGWQVDAFAERIKAGGPLQLPPMVDIEDQQELSRQDLTDYAYVTLDGVEKATGVKPILYTYLWFLDNAIFWEQLKRWPLSLARWTEDPSWPDSRAVFWQYSANRSVSWAVGPVDFQRTR